MAAKLTSSGGELTLYPAIDVRDGRAVRLLQGDYARETVYDADPIDAARRWVDGGARALHVVDLDGARAGRPANLGIVAGICAQTTVPLQLGGGLRDRAAVEEAFEAGAERAVLGTSAQRSPELLGELASAHGERIVASVDARSGNVAVEGWEEATTTTVTDAIAGLGELGVRLFIYTPVEVDGTLEGPGLDGLGAILDSCDARGAKLIYSGGVGTLDHIRELAALDHPALDGVIVGRALYEGKFTIAEGLTALGSDGEASAWA